MGFLINQINIVVLKNIIVFINLFVLFTLCVCVCVFHFSCDIVLNQHCFKLKRFFSYAHCVSSEVLILCV